MRKAITIAAAILWVLVSVVTVSAVTVTDVYNAPNPLVTQTTFYLVYYPTPHDFDSVVIKIYDLSGQQVAQPYAGHTDRVTWNGTDSNGNQLANGGYLYKAYVYEKRQGVPYLFWQSSTKIMFISR
jgi:flagellar hook assembly protein FlgD